ncbi:flagellar hook-associated protein 3 [Leptospira sp. GIMC2001]|uniref:flagellar hook-associated protein 3 n=1 Tax=Leptospira sp. GIMC2001 TaxID=1513297 RepID=UPI002349CDE8|nr:flagellar hook-associated protein 3 [Leptospira sp. GIMC2001]WCL51298.1 flagellar hook-associated protein 3 [Leptospira sp. GIMC2001]
MRITNMMQNNSLIRNLNRHQVNFDSTQNQLATGLKIQRPSDDPSVATNQMFFRSRLNELNQFEENITDGYQRLKHIDGVLDRMGEIFQRARVLAVQAANGIYQGDKGFELEVAIGKEIDQHLRAMVDLANSRDATGQPVFGGHVIERPPFEPIESKIKGLEGLELKNQYIGVQYRGDIGEQLREIEKGEYIPVTVPGNKVFWGTNMSVTSKVDNSGYVATSDQKFKIDGVEIHVSVGDTIDDVIDKINNSPLEVKANKLAQDNISLTSTSPHQIWVEDMGDGTVLKDIGLIDATDSEPPNNYSKSATVTGLSTFDVLIQFRNDLLQKDQERIGGRDLGDLDLALENILRYRSEVGARMNRLEQHEQRVAGDKSYMTELLAKNEGIDFPETIMNLKWLETIHQYALNVGSKVIKPTLMDFLR